MTKRKKRKHRKKSLKPVTSDKVQQGRNYPENPDRQAVIRYKGMNWILWFSGGLIVIFTKYYLHLEDFFDVYNNLPELPRMISKTLFYGLIIIGFLQILYTSVLTAQAAVLGQRGDYVYLKKVARLQVVVATIALSNIIIAPLYATGIAEKISKFLFSLFPKMRLDLNTIVVYLLAVIAAGVIGNFAYDILKRLFSRKDTL